MIKVKCEICELEISTQNIKKHLKSHERSNKTKRKIILGECAYCGLSYTNLTYKEKVTHNKNCNLNPNKNAISKGISKAWKEGKYKNVDHGVSFRGKHHSEKTKKLISKSLLKSDHQRVCKKSFDYIKLDGSIVRLDSKYEERVAIILDKNKIKWIS